MTSTAKSILFTRLTREPAYLRVAGEIERKIVSRALGVGELLPPETEIAEQFGVHRSTVREAYRQLESAGLLSRRPGSKRMVVSRPDGSNVAHGLSRALLLNDVTFHDVWEAMMLIQPELAALAAARRTPDTIGTLRRLRDEFAVSPAGDRHAVTVVGQYFETLAVAARNPVLALSAQPLVQLLEPSLAQMIDRVAQARTRIREAQGHLVTALEQRDREDARQWMVRHVRDFRRGLELAGIAMDRAVGDAPTALVTGEV